MVYLEISRKNHRNHHDLIKKVNNHLNNKDNKLFILFFMEGCGPCNETRPEWSKLQNVLSDDFLNKPDIAIVSIDKNLFGKLKHIKRQPNGFPTMRYITHSGNVEENYEDSNISTKDRTIDSFVEWIKVKSGVNNITKSESTESESIEYRYPHKKTYKYNINSRSKTKKRGGKWSSKYKRSINCKRPRGFSQKQYCKYSRKK
jgi:thiol-disulfide isomerase/thioredoxin